MMQKARAVIDSQKKMRRRQTLVQHDIGSDEGPLAKTPIWSLISYIIVMVKCTLSSVFC